MRAMRIFSVCRLMLNTIELRYYWTNVVSGVRAYLAFRNDEILRDIRLYHDAALSALASIMAYDQGLQLDIEAAVAQLQQAMQRFDRHWQRLQSIHGGEGWRADSKLMQARILPQFDAMEAQLQAFSEELNTAMDTTAARLLDKSRQITRLAGALLVIGVLLSVSMAWGISRIVSRPIRQAAAAMQNIASADADLTQRLAVVGDDEVALLSRSFNTFVRKAQCLAEEERALSALLRLSLEQTDIHDYLHKGLGLLVETLSWLSLQPRGAIFVADHTGDLRLCASYDFSAEKLASCDRVRPGQCLCGRAAASDQVEFVDCAVQNHEIRCDSLQNHGHYCVPILSGTVVLGVLALYLPEDHTQKENDVHFLERVAEVFGIGITLRQTTTDLVEAKRKAEVANDQLIGITANLPGIIYQFRNFSDGRREYTYVSAGTSKLLGSTSDDPQQDIIRLFSDIHHQDQARVEAYLTQALGRHQPVNVEYRVMQQDGDARWILCNAFPHRCADESDLYDGLLLDITDRKNLETQLLQAQKLESVGQLAAGIAHEINTPTQYVRDNTRFLQEAFAHYREALLALQQLREPLPTAVPDAPLLAEVDRVLEEKDIEYLMQEIPQAIDQSLDGLQHIASIVSAMKEFSHPGSDEKQRIDINGVVQNIVTVSRNEWKYVAELETDFDPGLPPMLGYRDKLGQVILNMIVNAAHAIADKFTEGDGDKGRIQVRTARIGQMVEIRIIDNGPGVPADIRERIFDPFFTTKEVGKGTGQGLSIAHAVVADLHQGRLALESTPGGGATFVIHLPLPQDPQDDEIAA